MEKKERESLKLRPSGTSGVPDWPDSWPGYIVMNVIYSFF